MTLGKEIPAAVASAALEPYAVAVGAFVALLGIAVHEGRDLRDQLDKHGEGAAAGALKARLVGVGTLALATIAGALVSLSVLFSPPPGSAEQWAVIGCFVVAVVGVGLLLLTSLRTKPILLGPVAATLLMLGAAGLAGATGYLLGDDEEPAFYTYQVFGTCVGGECGLNERLEPDKDAGWAGRLRDGDRVDVVCQVVGGVVREPNGLSSKVWNKLTNDNYVSDVAIDTPRVGNPIPACE